MTDTLPITNLPSGSVSPAVLVCGDQNRAAKIAESLKSSVVLSEKREYRAFQGDYSGLTVTICSHGVGAPGAAIAFEELIAAGAQTIIRVGTCGGIQPDITDGDLVIGSAAVQNTGYGLENLPPGYPAAADPILTIALINAANEGGRSHRTGIVLTRDVFYKSPAAPQHAPDYRQLSKINVLAVEMECAALFQVSSMHGIRAGAVLAVDGNVLEEQENIDAYSPDREIVHEAVEAAIHIALEAQLALN